MNSKHTISFCLELEKAIAEGYTVIYSFTEGMVYPLIDPLRLYPITSVLIKPFPCVHSRMIVYRIETAAGEKGYALLDFENNDE